MRYLIALLLLCVPASAKELVTPDSFELVGGYHIPGENAVGFVKGGLAIDTTPGSERVWLDSHLGKVMEYSLPPLGSGAVASWPMASKTAAYWQSQFGIGGGSVEGLLYDPQEQRLYAACRSGYFVPPTDPPCWLGYLQFPAKTATPLKVTSAGIMNRYGGGLCLIPADFASHVGGKRMAFSSGGYKSGQNSTAGPTLAAFDPREATIAPQRLLNFGNFDAKDKNRVERRFPDYNDISLNWFNRAEGEVGYWQADSVYGGAAWIDHPDYKGVCFQSLQGTGNLDYKIQDETFAQEANKRQRFYVYDPDALAAGPPESQRGKFHEWKSQGVPGKARGMAWSNGLLWVCYAQAYKSGVESYPIIAAYRLKTISPPPDPHDQEIAALKAQITTLTGEVNSLIAERDALTTARDVLAVERNALSAERDSLTDQLAALQAVNANLTHKSELLDQLKQTLQEVLQ